MESESAIISDVIQVFQDIKKSFDESEFTQLLSSRELVNFQQIYSNRCQTKFVNDFHYLAYYLDPRYRSNKLIEEDLHLTLRVYNRLQLYAESLNLIENDNDKKELADSLRSFRESEGIYGSVLLIGSSPNSYWKHLKNFPSTRLLSEIARRLLSIPASSAGVERSFSAQNRVHTVVRNRLSNERIEKIMRIKWFLNKKQKVDANEAFDALSENIDFDIEEVVPIDDPINYDFLEVDSEKVVPIDERNDCDDIEFIIEEVIPNDERMDSD